jgi:hypothetical protein
MANGTNGKRGIPPGVPNIGDLSQPTADEATMSEAQRRAEEMRNLVQQDLQRDPNAVDERFRLDDRDGRDEDLDMARGGERAYSRDQWDRAMVPTDPERRRLIQARFRDSVLPNLPKREGWRRCWVSTTHNYDTPQFRIGIGYHFCTYEQLSQEGWSADAYAVKDSRNVYAGCVMWREMIAMETDEKNWYTIMRELHHDQPYELARGIYDTLDAAGERVRDAGGRTSFAPGMEQLKTYTRPPRQFE